MSDTSSIGTIIKKQNTEMVSMLPNNFFGAFMGNALSSCDKNSSRLMKKDSRVIDIEEEYIYFQYNSDGEFHHEERQVQMHSFFNIGKQSTYKRMKTTQNDNSFVTKQVDKSNEME